MGQGLMPDDEVARLARYRARLQGFCCNLPDIISGAELS